ncbi:nucleotidyltransferase family protein [Rhodanobacter sp. Col0626]|uniref:nucleotidyltransferase family protein n=1 Tax=Rhodanobacter sp. Col0626 TaxID=3415679 RepID=UPI003CEB84FF
MTATVSPAVVVLAAGEGRRFGGIKQLAEVAGQPMVRRIACVALDSGLPVFVVIGAHADRVEAALDQLAVHIVRHPAWQAGMGSSLAAGIRCVQQTMPTATAVLLCLADQPLIDAATLKNMCIRHASAPERILVSAYGDAVGPPTLFPCDCFDALAGWNGTRGAQSLLQREAQRVDLLPLSTGLDVDRPEDLLQVRRWLER